jgi:SpoVK/Ycf46/Vps4 family AAA+-type ATPase
LADRETYRVDLNAVICKYIAETEKNLKRGLKTAEQSGVILFFNEADCLFGKRSEVKDSHDRYANSEFGYLLRRIKSFPGLVVLASSTKVALDPTLRQLLR